MLILGNVFPITYKIRDILNSIRRDVRKANIYRVKITIKIYLIEKGPSQQINSIVRQHSKIIGALSIPNWNVTSILCDVIGGRIRAALLIEYLPIRTTSAFFLIVRDI